MTVKTTSSVDVPSMDKSELDVINLPCNKIDTILFDIDGVLIDVKKSFQEVVSRTVQFYFKEELEFTGNSLLMKPEENELFKMAGMFNNDWNITYAVALFYLWKSKTLKTTNIDTLTQKGISLQEFTMRIKRLGGGLQPAQKIVFDNMDKECEKDILALWDKNKLWHIFQEIYCGRELCPEMYNIKPRYVMEGEGLIKKEKTIIDKSMLKEMGDKLSGQIGCITGRVWDEAKIVLDLTGLRNLFKDENIITEDVFKKPDPGGLIKLSKKFNTRYGLFIGDTIDDLDTVKNYRTVSNKSNIFFAAVATGVYGNKTWEFFKKAGANIIARDVNVILSYFHNGINQL